MPELPGRPRLRWIVLGTLAMLLIAGGVLVAAALRSQRDVSHPDVEFVETVPPTAPAPPPKHVAPTIDWPRYGFDKARTHYLPLARPMRPPFTNRWAVRGRVLLEFTPVQCGKSLFLLKNNGALYRISATSGRVMWKRRLGVLAASSPVCGDESVFVVLLQRTHRSRAGRVVSLAARSGRTHWSRPLPSRSETSPLLDHGRIYIGSEDGTVYALRSRDGAVRWTYKASGAVKGAIALANRKLFFGDYSGQVYALRQRDGGKIWVAGTSGAGFGLRSGTFYATPAIAYGRVFIGNTDGNIYSFAAKDGKLAWRTGTGSYVYASPAVAPAGGRPTVYAGSYDGKFYALDARSGRKRWVRDLGSKISGAASVIGDLVFVTALGSKTTWGLGAATGATVWKTRRGAFNPVISDGRRLYLNGYSSLFGMRVKRVP